MLVSQASKKILALVFVLLYELRIVGGIRICGPMQSRGRLPPSTLGCEAPLAAGAGRVIAN